ncbi:hypothetical protein J120_04030 [candidate division TM6 bacterium JCVI TM6SC1]|uniref:Uncharacterized protein n=1 Tax=candidate division TM6 bacterium JCVI TM6SC1 TaxID=1306947 RepID=A0A0D2JDL2_9BACT|nr:hypothetical protein J120_04030 [candidate division TM6 bacterium JCVI TM6SC1]
MKQVIKLLIILALTVNIECMEKNSNITLYLPQDSNARTNYLEQVLRPVIKTAVSTYAKKYSNRISSFEQDRKTFILDHCITFAEPINIPITEEDWTTRFLPSLKNYSLRNNPTVLIIPQDSITARYYENCNLLSNPNDYRDLYRLGKSLINFLHLPVRYVDSEHRYTKYVHNGINMITDSFPLDSHLRIRYNVIEKNVAEYGYIFAKTHIHTILPSELINLLKKSLSNLKIETNDFLHSNDGWDILKIIYEELLDSHIITTTFDIIDLALCCREFLNIFGSNNNLQNYLENSNSYFEGMRQLLFKAATCNEPRVIQMLFDTFDDIKELEKFDNYLSNLAINAADFRYRQLAPIAYNNHYEFVPYYLEEVGFANTHHYLGIYDIILLASYCSSTKVVEKFLDTLESNPALLNYVNSNPKRAKLFFTLLINNLINTNQDKFFIKLVTHYLRPDSPLHDFIHIFKPYTSPKPINEKYLATLGSNRITSTNIISIKVTHPFISALTRIARCKDPHSYLGSAVGKDHLKIVWYILFLGGYKLLLSDMIRQHLIYLNGRTNTYRTYYGVNHTMNNIFFKLVVNKLQGNLINGFRDILVEFYKDYDDIPGYPGSSADRRVDQQDIDIMDKVYEHIVTVFGSLEILHS